MSGGLGPTILQQCLFCGKSFYAPIKEIRRGRGKLCSKICANNWQSQTKTIGEGSRARKNAKRRADRTKDRAREAVARAIKVGILIRQPCVICGQEKAEAHHEDYSKPLKIIWLCQKHHREADLRLGLRVI
jgi:hypothetical protein